MTDRQFIKRVRRYLVGESETVFSYDELLVFMKDLSDAFCKQQEEGETP